MGGRDVAVKVIHAFDVDDGARLRFERECAASGRLSWHPNVVSFYDAGFTESQEPYLVMEYLPAGSYGDRVRRDHGLPLDRVLRVGTEIADALQAAHGAGLLHRDVKPSNILVGPRGTPMLADFGLAVIDGLARSRTGTFNATIAHAPPEVLAGARADHLADVYSLGSTLFTLTAGHPPFEDPDDDSLLALVERIAHDVPHLTVGGAPPNSPTSSSGPWPRTRRLGGRTSARWVRPWPTSASSPSRTIPPTEVGRPRARLSPESGGSHGPTLLRAHRCAALGADLAVTPPRRSRPWRRRGGTGTRGPRPRWGRSTWRRGPGSCPPRSS